MRQEIAQHRPYLWVARHRFPDYLSDSTNLVLDGFPRSGNTFALVAFQIAQSFQPVPFPAAQMRLVRVSHHIHSTAHLIEAARRGLPVLVPVREPEGAVLSCLIREPWISMSQAVRAYADFHERLLPWRERVLVVDFTDITTDMGLVIERLNRRFDTNFMPFQHTPKQVDQCFGIIEDRARRPRWDAQIGSFLAGRLTLAELERHSSLWDHDVTDVPEHRVARPSEKRARSRVLLEATYRSPNLKTQRERAERAYRRLLGQSSL
jgi:hypothetical protein